MGIDNLCIVFDNPNLVYYPGQVISGTVLFILNRNEEIKAIDVKVKGKAKVSWTETESYRGSDDEMRTREIVHNGKQEFFSNKFNILGPIGSVKLSNGQYNYPFSTALPSILPSSFEGEYGAIRYVVKVKVEVHSGKDAKAEATFRVDNPYNLNLDPKLKESVKQEVDKTFCCLCCTQGPLTIIAYVPYTGYVPGQVIPITMEIDNASNVNVQSVRCSLIKRIKWTAHKPSADTKWSEDRLVTKKLDGVPGHTTKTWTENLTVPGEPVPNLCNCNIIEMTHTLKIEADPEGMHTDLEITIPLKLGGIPISEVANSDVPNIAICPPFSPPPYIDPHQGAPNYPLFNQQPSAPPLPSAPIPYYSQTPPPLVPAEFQVESVDSSIYPIVKE